MMHGQQNVKRKRLSLKFSVNITHDHLPRTTAARQTDLRHACNASCTYSLIQGENKTGNEARSCNLCCSGKAI